MVTMGEHEALAFRDYRFGRLHNPMSQVSACQATGARSGYWAAVAVPGNTKKVHPVR